MSFDATRCHFLSSYWFGEGFTTILGGRGGGGAAGSEKLTIRLSQPSLAGVGARAELGKIELYKIISKLLDFFLNPGQTPSHRDQMSQKSSLCYLKAQLTI